jgi:hypothetical protein
MAEKEYIEREALIRYAEKQEVIIKDGTSISDAMRIQGNVFRRAVECCPAADVVEVVRCRDCKYIEPKTCPITGVELLICRHGCVNIAVEKDHFCSYGERREQG